LVERAHASGIAVNVWTVNDADSLDRMLDLGVDGIITDRVDLARAAIDRR
jgi:glycerophosphoryl diester phosphodiesterase